MKRLFAKIVDVKPDEIRALWLAFIFNFLVLGGYYILRPIRDEIGAAGREHLSWLFTATLLTMLVGNALFSALVARMSRRRFIPIAYRFFIANLLIFYLLMRTLPGGPNVWVGRIFFVWVSVFNLFVISVFWAFMTDVFSTEQAKRLFGFIAIGGTLGAILGGTITASLVRQIGTANLLIASAVMLEAGAWCVRFFPASFQTQDRPVSAAPRRGEHPQDQHDEGAEKPIGGSLWAGITHVARSPYLLGICGFILLHTITATLIYFQQADIIAPAIPDRAARTEFFANLDRAVNTITVIVQLFLTGRLLKWLGVGLTLSMLPLFSIIGFIGLGLMPILGLLAVFQVLRRAADYAIGNSERATVPYRGLKPAA